MDNCRVMLSCCCLFSWSDFQFTLKFKMTAIRYVEFKRLFKSSGKYIKRADVKLKHINSDSLSWFTHFPLDKMAAISQTIFSDAFLEWKVLYFDYTFTEVCSQGSNLQWTSIGSDNILAPKRRQAIIWTNADPIHWHTSVIRGRWVLIYVMIWSMFDR